MQPQTDLTAVRSLFREPLMSDPLSTITTERQTDKPILIDSSCHPANRRANDPPTPADVRDSLRTVQDPALGEDIVTLGLVSGISVTETTIAVELGLYAPHSTDEQSILNDVYDVLDRFGRDVVTFATTPFPDRSDPPAASQVRNLVPLVGAGKGAETSAIATGIATALARNGIRSGLVDLNLDDAQKTVTCADRECSEHDNAAQRTGDGLQVAPLITDRPLADGRFGEPSQHAARLKQRCFETIWFDVDYLFVAVPTVPDGTAEAFLDAVLSSGTVVTVGTDDENSVVRHRIAHLRNAGEQVLGIIEQEQLQKSYASVAADLINAVGTSQRWTHARLTGDVDPSQRDDDPPRSPRSPDVPNQVS